MKAASYYLTEGSYGLNGWVGNLIVLVHLDSNTRRPNKILQMKRCKKTGK